jgi:organic hydroperoxide reductase OsmC/OhrA
MQNFPHRYVVSASAAETGDIDLTAAALPTIVSAPPAEFDGPGDRWSPETLLVAAVGDCLILTFRAVARASRVPWTTLRCDVAGTLARVDNVTRFTTFDVHARLSVPSATDPAVARQAVERAERHCLISNSLKATINLTIDVDVAAAALVGAV